METPPPGFWEALVGLFAAATIYLGVQTRNAKKAARTAPSDGLLQRLDRGLDAVKRDVERHDERLGAIEADTRNHGERLVRQESIAAEAIRRMDARDAAAAVEREEDMAWRGRIEGKLDRLIERGLGGH